MLTFEASIYGNDNGHEWPLPVTFDVATAALQSLPRLFIEPDGSFVWTGEATDGRRWQVDGNLIDRGDSLARVELKGCCPEDHFGALLKALGWPANSLCFHLVQRGVLLDEVAFRRLAASPTGAV
jgi:hypothetical protein